MFGFLFTKAEMETIEEHFNVNHFRQITSLVTYQRHTRVIKTILRYSAALRYVRDEIEFSILFPHLHGRILVTASNPKKISFLCGATWYVSNLDLLNDNFIVCIF